MTIGVGVIGYGYWGPNLVRNFAAQGGGARGGGGGYGHGRAGCREQPAPGRPHLR